MVLKRGDLSKRGDLNYKGGTWIFSYLIFIFIDKKLKNLAILGHSRRSNFKIFFNHGEDDYKIYFFNFYSDISFGCISVVVSMKTMYSHHENITPTTLQS